MALRLSENWRDELSRTRLAGRFSAPQIAELWPNYPADAPVTIAEAVRLVDESVATQLANLRSEEHTSELQSLMRISYAVFCLKKKRQRTARTTSYFLLLVDMSYIIIS